MVGEAAYKIRFVKKRMGLLTKVVVLVALQYISPLSGVPNSLPPTLVDRNNFESTSGFQGSSTDIEQSPSVVEDDDRLEKIESYLVELLLLPWNGRGLPLLYIEDELPEDPYTTNSDGSAQEYEPIDNEVSAAPYKRSRLYRKYPWKRQNSRQTYDAENRFLCQPSKDDVLRLLVALHEARQGTRGRTINFCNRKRPATAIFTNMRFLG